MIKLGEEKLKEYIRSIGLYQNKAKNVIKLSEKIIADHNGEIPNDFDYLITLPGVGRKTANVFLNSAFNSNNIGVDTHVYRVSNRLGLVKSKNADNTERQLNKKIPTEYKHNAHHWLVLHGRYICKAQKPKCDICKLVDICKYFKTLDKK